MLKILLAILKAFPQGLALLNGYSKAQNRQVELQLEQYRIRVLSDSGIIAGLRADASEAAENVKQAQAKIADLATKLAWRELELERLQNETQLKLKAVAAMDSESVFNASLSGADTPIAEGTIPVLVTRR